VKYPTQGSAWNMDCNGAMQCTFEVTTTPPTGNEAYHPSRYKLSSHVSRRSLLNEAIGSYSSPFNEKYKEGEIINYSTDGVWLNKMASMWGLI
jgi:hypothetical protein